MEKNTKILIGASALALAYYLYNASKAAAAISPIGATLPPITTPASPLATTPMSPSLKDAIKELGLPVKVSPYPIGDMSGVYDGAGTGVNRAKDKAREEAIAAKIAADEAAALAAQEEADRLTEMLAYEEENARQEAMRLANQKAYQEMLRLEAIKNTKREWEKEEADRIEAERQKAMNAFMYPTCPEGFEFYQNNCMPTYIIVEEKAKRGEGLILRDFKNNKTTLVQTCPAEYVKQGINCIPRYSLSPQELQVIAMQDAGMVQTSDGQWYLDAKSAAAAQAIIDAQTTQYGSRAYSDRQKSINDAICSITTSGVINNPYSSATNGMSLRQYVGQFKVTASELSIARASCPNSVYSSGYIAGGRTDDNALGYKGY
jgi:hypothetical protein